VLDWGSILIEELLRLVALQPLLKVSKMLRIAFILH